MGTGNASPPLRRTTSLRDEGVGKSNARLMQRGGNASPPTRARETCSITLKDEGEGRRSEEERTLIVPAPD